MSWFGESLSNIKGQISNIAKEVLAEGADEVDDQQAQLKLANERTQMLEAAAASYTAEITRLELRNSELEERLSTADLQLSSISQRHREEIVTREKELLSLRNQLSDVRDQYLSAPPDPDPDAAPGDLGHEGSELDDLLGAQRRINRLEERLQQVTRERDQLLKQEPPEQHGVNDSGRLQSRVQELERQLQETVDRHQEQLSALQDSYQEQLERLRAARSEEKESPRSEERESSPRSEERGTSPRQVIDPTERTDKGTSNVNQDLDQSTTSASLQRLTTERDRLLATTEGLAAERDRLAAALEGLTTDRDRLAAALEAASSERAASDSRLKQLTEEKEEFATERESLLASLEELDAQNQAANDQVQRWRSEATQLSSTREELLKRLEESQRETDTLRTETETLRTETVERSAARDEAVKTSRELQRRLDEAEATTAGDRDDLQRRLQEKDGEITALTAVRDELQGRLDEREAEVVSLTAVRADLQGKLEKNNVETSASEELLQRLRASEAETKSLQAARDELEQKLQATEAEAASLSVTRQELFQSLRAKDDETALLTTARNDLLVKLKEIGAEVASLKEELQGVSGKLEKECAGNVEAMAKVEHLQLALETAQDERDATKRSLSQAKETEEEMDAKNIDLQDRIDKLQGSVSGNDRDSAKMKKEIVLLENSVSKLEDEKRVLQEHFDYYMEEQLKSGQSEKYASLQAEHRELQDRFSDLESSHAELVALSLAQCSEAPPASDAAPAVLQQPVAAVREEPEGEALASSEPGGAVQTLQTRLEAEQRDVAQLRERTASLESSVGVLGKERDTLREQVGVLREQLEAEQDQQEQEQIPAPLSDSAQTALTAENQQIAIRLLDLLTRFNSDDIFASNSSTAALLDTLERSVQELQWRLQETAQELERTEESRGRLQERLEELEQEQLLEQGSQEKLETISEDAERVAELEAEVTRLRAGEEGEDSELGEVKSALEAARGELTVTRGERDEALLHSTALQERLNAREEAVETEEQLRYDKEEVEVRLQMQDAELAELRVRLTAAEGRAAAEETAQVSTLQTELESVRQEMGDVTSQLGFVEEEKRVTQEQRDEASLEKYQMKLAVQESEQQLLSLRGHIEEEVARNSELNSQLESVKEEFSTFREASAQKCGHLETALEESNKNAESLRLSLEEELTRSSAAVAQLETVHQEVSAYKEASAEKSRRLETELETLRQTASEVAQRRLVEGEEGRAAEAEAAAAELTRARGELSSAQESVTSLQQELETAAAAVGSLTEERDSLTLQQTALAEQRDVWLAERQQLIDALSQKHAESVQYHAEIQRLQQVQAEQVETRREEEAAQLAVATAELTQTRQSRDEARAQLAAATAELTQTRQSRDEVRTQAQQLRASQDQLLIRLQERNQLIQQLQSQTAQHEEKSGRLETELQRLRDHLLAMEDSYTEEAVSAEQREGALRERLSDQQRYNADSEAAVQHIDSLQEQLSTISQQRDDAILQLDDVTNSLTNLQRVLEQFQREKQREIGLATGAAQRQAKELQQHVDTLKTQLQEASEGLAAANRLNEQLDRKEELIVALRADVEAKVEQHMRLQKELEEIKSNTSGKVDKSLVKNLVVGYVCAPAGHEREVLRVIATVLDFSREERARSRLDPALTSAAPPPAGSLSQAFVRFLEAESTPRRPATLPAERMAQETARKAEGRSHQRAQTPLVAAARTTPPAGHSRQSSTSSNLLLSLTEEPQLAAAAAGAAAAQPPPASSSSVLRAIMDDQGEPDPHPASAT